MSQATLVGGDMSEMDIKCIVQVPRPTVVLAGCWDENETSRRKGILRSANNGASWSSATFHDHPTPRAVTSIVPLTSSTILAAAEQRGANSGSGLWYSTNLGSDWYPCMGDPGSNALGSLRIGSMAKRWNSGNSELLVGTYCAGIWRGDIYFQANRPTVDAEEELRWSPVGSLNVRSMGFDQALITYSIGSDAAYSRARLGICALDARLIEELVQIPTGSGEQMVLWPSRGRGSVSSGAYVCRLIVDDHVRSERFVVIR